MSAGLLFVLSNATGVTVTMSEWWLLGIAAAAVANDKDNFLKPERLDAAKLVITTLVSVAVVPAPIYWAQAPAWALFAPPLCAALVVFTVLRWWR